MKSMIHRNRKAKALRRVLAGREPGSKMGGRSRNANNEPTATERWLADLGLAATELGRCPAPDCFHCERALPAAA